MLKLMPSPRLRIQTVSNMNLSSLVAVVCLGARKKRQRGERPLSAPDALPITHALAFPQHPAAF